MNLPAQSFSSRVFGSLLSWVSFFLLLGLTLLVWQSLRYEARERASALFDARQSELVQALPNRIEHYESFLYAGAGLFIASDSVSPDEWGLFTERMLIEGGFPGLLAAGYIKGQQSAGPIVYSKNATKADYDFLVEPEYKQALAEAAASGETIAVRVKESDLQEIGLPGDPSLLVLLSLKDADDKASGFVFTVLAVKPIAEYILGRPEFEHIRVQIFDQKEPRTLLYDSHPDVDPSETGGQRFFFANKANVALVGLPVSIEITTLPAFGSSVIGSRPLVVLVLGSILSVLAFVTIRNLFTTKERAVVMAKNLSREVEESKSRLEAIVDNMVDGLITIDEKGLIQSFNKACERMFGYSADEAIGQNVKMIMPPHYADNHDAYLDNYLKTGEAKVIGGGREVEGQTKDGKVFPVHLAVAEIWQQDERLFSGIVRDNTERKEYEAQLKRTNEELEQFAYIASHDLKAPLRGIDNLTKWLEEDLQDSLTEETREKLDLMRGRVSRLEALLEDILQYSRAGRIVDKPEEINTGDLVRQVVDTLALPEGFEVEVSADMPVLVAPYTPLQQIFLNLISNAYNHHDRKKGAISITAEDKGFFYEFSVTDDGPGIPEEFQTRVFKMFQTLQSRDKKEGSGLGMSIVKKLVEWQGGRVWIISKDGQRGTQVRFLWPKHFRNVEAKNAV